MRGRLFPTLLLIIGLASAAGEAAERREIVLAATENGLPAEQILTEAFRRAGYPLKLRFMPWVRCQTEARLGTIDGIYGATHTPERDADFLFTDEFLWQEVQSAFVRADDPADYKPTIEGLAEIRVGLMNGSATGADFDQAVASRRIRHVDYAINFDSLLLMLAGQRVEVIIADRRSVMGAAKQHGIAVRELQPPVFMDPVYVAFTRTRDMSDVSRAVSAALKGMKQDGSYAELFAQQPK